MFINPESGDYSVKAESPALKMGFKNFSMDKFGVQKPELKAIARIPVFPQPLRANKVSAGAGGEFRGKWQGATVKGLSGEEYSAFGVRKEDGGIYLVDVPAESFAAKAGLKTGDLVQAINGKSVKITEELIKATDRAKGKPLEIRYVRGQISGILRMKYYEHKK